MYFRVGLNDDNISSRRRLLASREFCKDYISCFCGSGSFYHQAKIVRKTLIPTGTVLWLFFYFLSLKNDVNVPSISNNQKNLFLKLVFGGVLMVNDEKIRIRLDPLVRGMDPRIWIRIHTKMSWIRNTAEGLQIRNPKLDRSIKFGSDPVWIRNSNTGY